MRADEAADHHRAGRAAALDLVDAQADEPVVDQHLVTGLEHVSDHRRGDRQLAVPASLLRADHDVIAGVEDYRLGQLADSELRALQVGDEGNRPADLGCDLAHEPGALGVVLVRPVREVETDGVDARLDQRTQALPRVGSRPERRHDLRPAVRRHLFQRS